METAPGVKSRLILNLVLLLALVALGLYVYLRPAPEENKPQIPLTTLKRGEVDRVRVQRDTNMDMQIQKHNGTWVMSSPYHTRVDPLQVDRLLDITLATASQKFPAESLTRYGLDPAPVVVTLNDQTFGFGSINDVTNEQYVANGGNVYLVRTYLGYNVPRDVTSLFSHKLLADNEIPDAYDFGGWKATKNDKGAWTLQGNLHTEREVTPTPNELNVWATEWNLASALSVTPYQGKPHGERVEIKFTNGSSATFRVLSRKPDVQLLRVDENMVYQLGPDAGGRLLDPYRVADNS